MRGPLVIKGYLNNANKDFDADGYFHTGDVALCDRETKKWYIVDRKKVSVVCQYVLAVILAVTLAVVLDSIMLYHSSHPSPHQ